MADPVDPKYLDKRTAERYLRGGQLDEQAYKSFIETLPDVAEKAATVETVMHDEYEDEEDDEDDEDDEDEDDEETSAGE